MQALTLDNEGIKRVYWNLFDDLLSTHCRHDPPVARACKVSDQVARQDYKQHEVPHMLSIANMSPPMLGEHWWIRTKYSGKGWI